MIRLVGISLISFLCFQSVLYGQQGFGANVESFTGDDFFFNLNAAYDAGDLNGDDQMDFVIGARDYRGDWLLLLMNEGEGHFGQVVLEEGFIPEEIEIHDFNNDGYPDILADGNRVWLNDGAANFTELEFISSYINKKGFCVTDFNSDGFLDFLMPEWYVGGGVYLMLNNAGLGFTEQRIHSNDYTQGDVFYADMDQDGDRDLVVGHYDGVRVVFNDDGEFLRDTIVITSFETAAYVGDLTDDGYPDIVCYEHSSSKGAFFLNESFAAFPGQFLANINGQTDAVDVGDLNLDGRPDIVFGYEGANISWHENLGDSTFSTANFTDYTMAGVGIRIRDFDLNGTMDVVFNPFNSHGLGWYQNFTDSTGYMGEAVPSDSMDFVRHKVFGDSRQMEQIRVADLDGDSDVDVIGVNSFFSELIWWETRSDRRIRHIISQDFDFPEDLVVGDMNNDGTMDIVVVDDIENSNNFRAIAFFQNLDGSFDQDTIQIFDNTFAFLDGGDFNNDGFYDLMVKENTNDGLVRFYLNNGDSTISPVDVYEVNSLLVHELVDLDQDGNLDLVTSGDNNVNLEWLQGQGDGTFIKNVIASNVSKIDFFTVLDFNNDNEMDIVSGYGNNHLVVWQNDGAEGFTMDTLFEHNHVGDRFISVHGKDADLDGDIDLLAAYSSSMRGLVVLENQDSLFEEHSLSLPFGGFHWHTENENAIGFSVISNTYSTVFGLTTCSFENESLALADSSFCRGDSLNYSHWIHSSIPGANYQVLDQNRDLIGTYSSLSDSVEIPLLGYKPLGYGGLPDYFFLDGEIDGCTFHFTDTINIVDLHRPQINGWDDEDICEGETVFVRTSIFGSTQNVIKWYENAEEGWNYPTSDTTFFYHALDTITGCANFEAMNVTVHPSFEYIEYDTICENEIREFQGEDYGSPGSYTQTYQNAFGCDSSYTLELEVIWEEPSFWQGNGDTLLTTQDYDGYRWVLCPDYNDAPDQTSAFYYVPPVDGTYAVEIEKNGCLFISSCETIIVDNLTELNRNSGFRAYFGQDHFLHIDFPTDFVNKNIRLIDLLGRTVREVQVTDPKGTVINLAGLASGYYVVQSSAFPSFRVHWVGH